MTLDPEYLKLTGRLSDNEGNTLYLYAPKTQLESASIDGEHSSKLLLVPTEDGKVYFLNRKNPEHELITLIAQLPCSSSSDQSSRLKVLDELGFRGPFVDAEQKSIEEALLGRL